MKPLVKVPLKYGVIAGVLGSILLVVLYLTGRHPFLITIYADFRIVLFGVFIFFTLKELRDHHYSGVLYFWQALIASFIFVSTFAVIASSLMSVFAWVTPEFVKSYVRLTLEVLRGIPPELIDQIGKDVYQRNLESIPATNIFDLALLYFMQSYGIGLFISIILSVILRRHPKT